VERTQESQHSEDVSVHGHSMTVYFQEKIQYHLFWENAREYAVSYRLFRENEKEYTAKKRPDIFPYEIGYSIHADPDKARRMKNGVSVLAVCLLKDGLPTFEATQHQEATADLPISTDWKMRFLNTALLAVWFFDAASGEIYAKIEPKK
jgi:hypothetical protein